MVRPAILVLAAMMVSVFASAATAAGPFGSIHVGNWMGGAYTDDKTGVFSHCSAVSDDQNGSSVTIVQNARGQLTLGFAYSAWHLSRGEKFPITITFDGRAQVRLFGTAATDTIANAPLPSNICARPREATGSQPTAVVGSLQGGQKAQFCVASPFLEQFRKSHLMVALAKGQTFQLDLTSSGHLLLSAIANCVAKMKSGGTTNAGDFTIPASGSPVTTTSAEPTVTAAVPSVSTAGPTATAAITSASTGGKENPITRTGAGLVINRNGYIVTINHLVSNCVGEIYGNLNGKIDMTLQVVAADPTNDLALLQAQKRFDDVGVIRETSILVGDPVVAIGYPPHALPTSDLTAAKGFLSSLSGPSNDTRFMQITTPAQPGTGGGPLLDIKGNVLGLIAKNNNVSFSANVTNSTPENTSFAIKSGAVRDFLDNSAVSYQMADAHLGLETTQIANNARAYTVLIWCRANEDGGEKK